MHALPAQEVQSKDQPFIRGGTLHNRPVGGSSPSNSTTQSRATRDFLKLREWPAFSGITCGCLISAKGQLGWEPVLALLSLASKSRCPATETGAGRDRFDLGPYWGMRPSIWL